MARVDRWMGVRVRSFLLVGTLTAMASCTNESPGEPIETLATRADAITKGVDDTTHQAVMLESCDKPCICTGTLVKKDEALGIGWIITAAHCVPSATDDIRVRFYVQGDKAATFGADYANTLWPGAIRYPVVESTRHPDFDSGNISFDGKQPHDVAVIRIAGVGKDTPVMALGTATDGLAKDAAVISIGYGSTGAWNDAKSLGAAGTRHSAAVKVTAVAKEYITVSGKDPGGSVNVGDSGGPVVAVVDGTERVVGVHSAGVQSALLSVRQSTRVSSDLAWTEGELAKLAKVDTCNACLRIEMGGVRSCAKPTLACLDDANCNAYALCVESCANTGDVGPTKTCRDGCLGKHPQGAPLYEPAFACGCQACRTACGGVCPDEYLRAPTTTEPAADAGSQGTDGPASSRALTPSVDTGGCALGTTTSGIPTSPMLLFAWALLYRRKRASGY